MVLWVMSQLSDSWVVCQLMVFEVADEKYFVGHRYVKGRVVVQWWTWHE